MNREGRLKTYKTVSANCKFCISGIENGYMKPVRLSLYINKYLYLLKSTTKMMEPIYFLKLQPILNKSMQACTECYKN